MFNIDLLHYSPYKILFFAKYPVLHVHVFNRQVTIVSVTTDFHIVKSAYYVFIDKFPFKLGT